jgi:hypothetical protein
MIRLELGDLCGRNPDHLVQFQNLSFVVNNSFIEMSRSRLRPLAAMSLGLRMEVAAIVPPHLVEPQAGRVRRQPRVW